MYELALSEWGLTPEYINRHWTEEILALMFASRMTRYQKIAALRKDSRVEPGTPNQLINRLSSDDFCSKWNFAVEKRN